MRYLGGKHRIAARVCDVLERLRDGRPYREPFVGAGWVLSRLGGVREASDACQPLITLYRALHDGWIPPETLTEDQYARLSETRDPDDPMTAFAGFGCSFGGKYFGGMARTKCRDEDHVGAARRSLLNFRDRTVGVRFSCATYADLEPRGELVYCDPPYANTTAYPAGPFDSATFWSTVRRWSEDNVVVVSEYSAPDDFACVGEFQTKLELRAKGGREERVERLFVHAPTWCPF